MDLQVLAMETVHSHPEGSRIAAHLVERDEPVEAVVGRVLHALGHHGAGELLEAHGQLRLERSAQTHGQDLAQEVEQVSVQVLAPWRRARPWR
jgi:hypothetical protein